MEPEGAYLPESRISHFSVPALRSRVTYNLWKKSLKDYDVFQNMMIFDERKTLKRIRVMKTSGLKFTKAKMIYDMNQVHQNSKFYHLNL